MKTMLYKFLITYEGYEDKIWREVEVSSNYSLSKLAYLVMVSFDTQGNHLYSIKYNDTFYEMDFEGETEESKDPIKVKLAALNLLKGSALTMIYDFGCEHRFNIELIDITEMKKGTSRIYPKVTDGAGKGILDNLFPSELGEIIKAIDKSGVSKQKYISPEGTEEIWDYREFDIDVLNKYLKVGINVLKIGFEQ